jgi:hypothetical protein
MRVSGLFMRFINQPQTRININDRTSNPPVAGSNPAGRASKNGRFAGRTC